MTSPYKTAIRSARSMDPPTWPKPLEWITFSVSNRIWAARTLHFFSFMGLFLPFRFINYTRTDAPPCVEFAERLAPSAKGNHFFRDGAGEIQARFGAHPGHRGPPKARGACGAAIRPGHMARRESRGQSLLHYLFYRRIPGHVNQRLAFMNKKIDEISGEAQKSIPAEKQLRPAALSVLTAGFETDIII